MASLESNRAQSRICLASAVLALLAFAATAFVGVWAGGKDIAEACAAAGQGLDQDYRAEHWQEPGRIFPMRNQCNAGYDLVPAWVNPALSILPAILAICLVGSILGHRRVSRLSSTG